MNNSGWEHYAHTADMGIRGFGATKEEAFAEAALAMNALSVDPEKIRHRKQVEITCEQDDDELLLVAWLNGLLCEMMTRKMVFSKFEIIVDGKRLTGRAWGEKLDLDRHKPVVEIKGATYSDLRVYQDEKGRWVAQCIVDI